MAGQKGQKKRFWSDDEKCGDLLKIIWWDTQGACLFMKRLEKGRFVWPAAMDGKVCVTSAQLAMLLEGFWGYPLW